MAGLVVGIVFGSTALGGQVEAAEDAGGRDRASGGSKPEEKPQEPKDEVPP